MHEVQWASCESTEPLVHAPIELSQSTIRLLKFVRGPDGLMEGHLEHVHIEHAKARTYRALSYMWGTSSWSQSIRINGKSCKIKYNLYLFLSLFVERHPDEWLWVDQICINQDSTIERNAQVRLMSDVYHYATEVIIWLACEAIDPAYYRQPCNRLCFCHHEQHTYGIYGACLRGTSKHPYWRRLWIVQEVLLAQARSIWLNRTIMQWPEMEPRDDIDPKMWLKPESSTLDFLLVESYHIKRRPLDFGDVIISCYDSSCHDVRDKVYGLQAIIKEVQRVTIDYARSPEQIFVDTVVKLLLAESGRMYVKLWHLARVMGIYQWCDKGPNVVSAVLALARYYTDKSAVNEWFENELRTAVMYLIGSDSALLEEWISWHRGYASLSKMQWKQLTDAVCGL